MKNNYGKQRFCAWLMKGLILQLFLLLSIFSAAGVFPSAGQGILKSKISLNVEGMKIKSILKKIEDAGTVRFAYQPNQIDVDKMMSLSIEDLPLENVLGMIFDHSVLFEERGELVVILPANVGIAIMQVSGKVTDANTGEPLPGVNVAVKGTLNGTSTDADGKYNLSVDDSNATLVFTFVGYVLQEIAMGARSVIDVQLAADQKQLDEVVVVGYGTAKKKDITGAVSRADLNAFKESPNVSILQSLQGAVPGLNVGVAVQAGQDPDISIRGRNSISGGTAPLIVLDGIIYRGSIVDINPNDVASVDVLKDASAAAVYGSQASNGVILITSKAGKGNKKPIIEFSTSYSLQEITNKSMLPDDAAGFLRKKRDRYLPLSRTGPGLLTMNSAFDPSAYVNSQILEGIRNGTNTNWWELLTNKRPSIQNHDLSISGKNETISYFISLGLTNQQNVIKNDSYKRYNFRINLDVQITNWMKIGVQSFLGLSDYSGASPSLDDVQYMIPQLKYQDDSGAYIKLPDGSRVNPFLQIGQDNLDKRNTLFGLVYADVNIPFIKGLHYRLNFSQNLIEDKDYNFSAYAQNFNGEGVKINGSQYLTTLDNILSYQKSYGRHSVNATFLYGLEKRDFENTTARSTFFTNDILGYNKLDAGQANLQTAASTAWGEASLYSMARVIYTYNNKYILTSTIRRDGFSGFAPANKFGVFPSIAAAWLISEEKFIKDNISFLDDLKLRASYGINGNRTVGRYQTQAKIGASVANGYLYGDNGAAVQGQYLSALANGNLKWESTKSFNFGADFSLFKNRLSGSLNTYFSNTYDLLFNVDIPYLNGFSSSPVNIGKLKNMGQELTLTGRAVSKGDFSWDVTVNFSRNRNKVVSILGIDANKDGKEDDLTSSKIFINHPYGVAYDYNIIGMWQVADAEARAIPPGFTYGTYKVEDINKDNAYTAAADRKILGYTEPSYRFSIMNTFRYKSWEFSFFINSIQGGKNYYYGQPGATLPNPDNISNGNIFKFDYWTPENPNARYRQIGYYTASLGESFSPYIQRNFVRLQNATLSYSLPKRITEKIKFNRVKFFLNSKNLLTISDWDGWDPETGTGLDRSAYPLLKSYTIGLNVEF